MGSFILITIITSIILISITRFFYTKNSPFRYVLPLIVALISIILIVVSFIVGKWAGMGLGFISVAFFLASIIALIVSVLPIRTRY